jgi:hypothetical protein
VVLGTSQERAALDSTVLLALVGLLVTHPEAIFSGLATVGSSDALLQLNPD